MAFLWQHADWPAFRWDGAALLGPVSAVGRARGELHAMVDALGLEARHDLQVASLGDDAQSTSTIEGEPLPPASVRSSVVRRLGLDASGLPASSREIDGLVEVLDDAAQNHDAPLTVDRLHAWHAALFPTGRSGMREIAVGQWRDGPMAVQSGPAGRERVHFEAPPAERLDAEAAAFLDWFGASRDEVEGVVRAAVAHLWFETLHPYDDGNGRIGRAVADLALAQADGRRRRVFSLSRAIAAERPAYYRALETTQRGELDVTAWVAWFVERVGSAVAQAREQVDLALLRSRLRQATASEPLHPRQHKVLNKLIEAEPAGFEGGMTNAKYRAITRTSKATATRDLADLVARGWLEPAPSGGRSAHYRLAVARLRAAEVP